jgi:hypothetical protein
MVARIDLRVHAAAPSSRKDDGRFTAQADAYLNFHSTTRHPLLARWTPTPSQDSEHPGPDHVRQASPQINRGPMLPHPPSSPRHDETTVMTWDPTVFLEETQLGYSALESQLITSVLPVSKTPRRSIGHKHTPTQRRAISPDSHAVQELLIEGPGDSERRSASTLASSSPQAPNQSSYLKSPVLDRVSKKARLDGHAAQQTSEAGSSLALPRFPAVAQGRPLDQIRISTGQMKAVQQSEELSTGNDTTSELPTSYSLSNVTTDSSRSGHQSLRRSTSDPGLPVNNSVHKVGSLDQTAALTEQSSNGPEVQSSVQSTSGVAPIEQFEKPHSMSPIAVRDFAPTVKTPLKATAASSIVDDDARASLQQLPGTIMPSSPEVSIQPFESHVTHCLRLLVENPDIAGKYEPLTQSRDIRDTERGYWLLDLSRWSAQLQLDFFRFLTRMIGEGRVGWGVWCVREVEDAERTSVKVYCWGEVVRHVYLLLYAASKSKVRRLGLQWIDAEGEVVVQMRGPDHVGQTRFASAFHRDNIDQSGQLQHMNS